MYAAEVERYLEALNEELVIQGIVTPVPVLLLGGVFIMMEVDSRRATDDVDVLPFIGAEKDTATNLPLAVALHMAAEAVARRYRLHPAWRSPWCPSTARYCSRAPPMEAVPGAPRVSSKP